MKRHSMLHPTLLAALLAVVAVAPLAAKEVNVTKAQVPAAVLQAAAREAPGATMTGFAREEEKGKTTYEVELREKGMGTDLMLSPTGTVLSQEKTITMAELPAAVRHGFETSAWGKAKVLKVEQVTHGGAAAAATYELTVQSHGKRHEVELDADGEQVHR